jgi:hypothetical protein
MRELDTEATGIFRAILAELGNEIHCRIDRTRAIFRPLVVERPGKHIVSLAHYGSGNGDLIADPEMTFLIDEKCWYGEKNGIYPIAYRNDLTADCVQAVEFDGERPQVYHHHIQREITAFAEGWLRNIAAQQNIRKAETLETPRGMFRYGFDSEEEARAAGYGHWFTHDGVKIFGGGPRTPTGGSSLAVAVRPGRTGE